MNGSAVVHLAGALKLMCQNAFSLLVAFAYLIGKCFVDPVYSFHMYRTNVWK
jgi:hypothetical protein